MNIGTGATKVRQMSLEATAWACWSEMVVRILAFDAGRLSQMICLIQVGKEGRNAEKYSGFCDLAKTYGNQRCKEKCRAERWNGEEGEARVGGGSMS